MTSRGEDMATSTSAVSRKRPFESAADVGPPMPVSAAADPSRPFQHNHQLHSTSSHEHPGVSTGRSESRVSHALPLPQGAPSVPPMGVAASAAVRPRSSPDLHPHHPSASAASSSLGGAALSSAGKSSVPAPRTSKDKGYKGLRQFSMLVCKKVEEKGTTTYNEVADELVLQVIEEKHEHGVIDEKNIRRRVYDALNVLMAMDIIAKDKKAITWKGLPTSASQDLDLLSRERDFRAAELSKKRQQLQDLLIQQVCFRNLTAKNAERGDVEPGQKIPLPFIVVNTHSSAVIQCNMSKDLTDVMFDFSMPFEINDDNTILKRLGMHKTDMNSLREMMPADMLQYCQEHGLLDAMLQETPPAPATASPSMTGRAEVTKDPRLAPSDYDGGHGRRPAARSSP